MSRPHTTASLLLALCGGLSACVSETLIEQTPTGAGGGSSTAASTGAGGIGGGTCGGGLDLVVGASESTVLGGDVVFGDVAIAGTLEVTAYAGAGDEGWLHIRAHSIRIEETGIIDATATGYRGSSDMMPLWMQGPGAGATPPEIFTMMLPAPGGGASHAGAGGIGTDSCSPFAGAGSGAVYNQDLGNLTTGAALLGSAGGASLSAVNQYVGRGGHGGGGVILQAASIVIDGAIFANGGDALNTLGAAPGGGSGGAIVIVSNDLVIGPNARLEANGGDAGLAQSLFGGAGGGGLVVLEAPGDHGAALFAQATWDGGMGAQACCNISCGGFGLGDQNAPPPCIDADGDGFSNQLCGGDDCNDGDPAVNPQGCGC